MQAHRQRLHQGAFLPGNALGQQEALLRTDDNIFRIGTGNAAKAMAAHLLAPVALARQTHGTSAAADEGHGGNTVALLPLRFRAGTEAHHLIDPATGAPDADLTKKVQAAALKRGLLLLTCGVYGNVIRFLFPLTIEDHVFTEALGVLDAALADVLTAA